LATGKPVRDVERIVEHADGTTLIVSSTLIRCVMQRAS
jgi:hypothetical protein